MVKEKVSESISVPAKDPEKLEKPLDKLKLLNGDGTDKQAKDEDLSEEDEALKGELEMLTERLKENDISLHRPALERLRTLIRTSTSSMTSVPKPLKFLRPHYPALQQIYNSWPSSSTDLSADKNLLADILSVLAMTYSDEGRRETLKYRLQGGSDEDPGVWGHEYVRHLAAEIGEEYVSRQQDRSIGDEEKEEETKLASTDDLLELSKRLLPFLLSHNAESDACDLLLELETISTIIPFVTEDTFSRVGLYLVSCVNYLPPPEDAEVMRTAREIYRRQERYMEAMILSIRLGDMSLIEEDFASPKSATMKRQLAYVLARQGLPIQTEDDDITQILSNSKLADDFKIFGKELNLLDPKIPEDVYKSHLENSRTTTKVDSALQNLADTFVNSFVNAGFGNDKLMVEAPEGQSWIYKNKDTGMMVAAASLGVLCLWDIDIGMSHIDNYTYIDDDSIKAGATLANGLITANVKNENETALALLGDKLEEKHVETKIAAIIGLGVAYAGSNNEAVSELLSPFASDTSFSMEIASMATLALGFVFLGSCNDEIAANIVQAMMERNPEELKSEFSRYMALGLSLLYLGSRREEASEVIVELVKTIEAPVAKQTLVLLEACSFAGTGNVLKIQSMLHHCTDHLNTSEDTEPSNAESTSMQNLPTQETESVSIGKKEKEPIDDVFQSLAVLGLSLIGMGEDIGAEMLVRQFNHLMHSGEPVIRRTVPLALGLLSTGNPVLHIMDTLSKYSHDNDLDVAMNAVFAMGLLGAGSNNARLAQMLRQLATYYATQPDCLFTVRIAMGLVHLGKGTITINPFHTDRQLMSPSAVAGLLATLVAFTDTKFFILGKHPWLLYLLTMAMFPRFLITVNENGEHQKVSVRVGQAVDVVGQAGKPRTITGFQTHTTPVRLANTERAEMATEEFIPYASVLEGWVILAKNKGWTEEDKLT